MSGLTALVYFLEMMLRHPVAMLAPGLVVAILYGAGKAMGQPSLFWNERPRDRFVAGLASTLLAAESFLVAYLLDGAGVIVESTSFISFFVVGGAVWSLLVGARVLTLRNSLPTASAARTWGVAPAIRAVDDRGARLLGAPSSRAGFGHQGQLEASACLSLPRCRC